MIDLHCHILPGVDDGAGSLSEAVDMGLMAWENGTDVLVATPHFCRPDEPRRLTPAAYGSRLVELRAALRARGCPLRLVSGMEIFATPELPELLARKALLPLGESRYLLVEFYFDEDPAFMDRSLGAVEAAGYVPVVAHPERYEAVRRQPELAAQWFEQGRIIQLNKGTILGNMGQSAHRTAWWLLRRGLVHVIASDAHSAVRRTSSLAHVRQEVAQTLSWQYARILLEENPRRILNDEKILPAEVY